MIHWMNQALFPFFSRKMVTISKSTTFLSSDWLSLFYALSCICSKSESAEHVTIRSFSDWARLAGSSIGDVAGNYVRESYKSLRRCWTACLFTYILWSVLLRISYAHFDSQKHQDKTYPIQTKNLIDHKAHRSRWPVITASRTCECLCSWIHRCCV